MKWYGKVWKNYFNFNGRARRTEYWMFVLFNAIISAIFSIVIGIMGTSVVADLLAGNITLDSLFSSSIGIVIVMGILSLYGLAILIPSLAVVWRRLHDQGKSGWWIFINLVPFIGEIWFLELLCTPGTTGANKYGPDPKA